MNKKRSQAKDEAGLDQPSGFLSQDEQLSTQSGEPNLETFNDDSEHDKHQHVPDAVGKRGPYPIVPSIVIGRPSPEFEASAITREFRNTPYRPDTSLDGWSNSSFSLRAASIRGHLHRYNGTPRQDDFALLHRRDGDQLVVAIADGVSSASQSHIGSSTAVRYAIQWLNNNLAQPTDDTDWKGLVESTAWALIEQARIMLSADIDAEQAENLVATTLVCAVIDKSEDGNYLVHVISIGDSGAWIVKDGVFRSIHGGKCQINQEIHSSAVTGLPRIPSETSAVSVKLNPGEVLILGTDGFGDPLGDGSGEVGALFSTLLEARIPSLIEFARALDFSRETFDDDRTLVAIWPAQKK